MNYDPRRIHKLSDPAVVASLSEVLAREPITFLVGSAVSLFPPSAIVNGQLVTRALASRLSQGLQPRRLVRRTIERSAFEHVLQLNPNQEATRNWLLELFGATNPNSLHLALATRCGNGGAHIITTNYDRLLEHAAHRVGFAWNVLVSETDAAASPASPTLFKIHGCVSRRESLLFTMSHEAPLPAWKAQHFDDLTRDRIVIVLGYSGKDFEVCPALLGSNARRIIWNMLDDPGRRGFPSENAEHLFNTTTRMQVIVGDMHDLFGLDPQRPAPVNEAQLDSFLAHMSDADLGRWQVGLMNSIGGGHQSYQSLRRHRKALTPLQRRRALIGINYRRGRYLASAWHIWRAERMEDKPRADRVFCAAIGSAFPLSNYGALRTAQAAFSLAKRQYRMITAETFAQSRVNLPWLHVLLLQQSGRPQPIYRRRVRAAALAMLRDGQWGTYYLIRQEAELLSIDAPGELGINAPLLPSNAGFKHMGNLSSRVDDFSDAAATQRPKVKSVIRELIIAKQAGLNPNRWKCALAGLRHASDLTLRSKLSFVWEFAVGLWKCQYSTSRRIAEIRKLFRALSSSRRT